MGGHQPNVQGAYKETYLESPGPFQRSQWVNVHSNPKRVIRTSRLPIRYVTHLWCPTPSKWRSDYVFDVQKYAFGARV